FSLSLADVAGEAEPDGPVPGVVGAEALREGVAAGRTHHRHHPHHPQGRTTARRTTRPGRAAPGPGRTPSRTYPGTTAPPSRTTRARSGRPHGTAVPAPARTKQHPQQPCP
ncbi:hypothetical protein ACWEP3_12620, partial [Streptomyces albidoflavus]